MAGTFKTNKVDYSRNFKSGVHVITSISNVMGVNFFQGDSLWNPRMFFPLIVLMYANSSVVYSFYHYRNSFIMILRCLTVAPTVVQCTFKFYYLLKHRHSLRTAFGYLEKTYSLAAKVKPQRAKALIPCCRYYGTYIHIGIPSLVFIFIVTCSPPAYSYFVNNKTELIMDLLVPGIVPDTKSKFITTLCMQFLMSISGFTLTNLCDFIIFTLTVHVSMFTELFLATLNEMNTLMENCRDEKSKDSTRHYLRKCITMHQDLTEYISMLDTYVSKQAFYYLACASLVLTISWYCVIKTDWIGAYAFVAFTLSEVLLGSALGTFVEIMNEKMTDGIYNTSWHLLPVDCQKTIYLLLLKSQNNRKITIANAVPLNVRTGTSIIKAIYSYIMILLNFDN